MLGAMDLALSTALLALPADPAQLLARWDALLPDRQGSLATDPRLSLSQQDELLRLARARGRRCSEVAVPLRDERGRRAPSVSSSDREERRAARAWALQAARLAARQGAERLSLLPTQLSLHREVDELRRAFAEGDILDFDELLAERATLIDAAVDGWRALLDPLLNQAADDGLIVQLLGPTIWPQQLPDRHEIDTLAREFAGAPLQLLLASDWQHARDTLGWQATAEEESKQADADLPPEILAMLSAEAISALLAPKSAAAADQPAPPTSLRLADAAGLELRLPFGVGELDHAWLTEQLGAATHATLVCDPGTTREEVERAATLIAELR